MTDKRVVTDVHSGRTPPADSGPRETLLAAAVDYLATNGAGELSLRGLAAALGTSHRMLSYHFGSREGLLVAVVREVERRERAVLDELTRELDAGADLAQVARRFWDRFTDPSRWPQERLFFEIYGQALQGRAGTEPLLDGIVHAWLVPLTEWGRRAGLAPDAAAARARLGVAVSRGLLLDLLATGDRTAVDEAMDAFIALFQIDG